MIKKIILTAFMIAFLVGCTSDSVDSNAKNNNDSIYIDKVKANYNYEKLVITNDDTIDTEAVVTTSQNTEQYFDLYVNDTLLTEKAIKEGDKYYVPIEETFKSFGYNVKFKDGYFERFGGEIFYIYPELNYIKYGNPDAIVYLKDDEKIKMFNGDYFMPVEILIGHTKNDLYYHPYYGDGHKYEVKYLAFDDEIKLYYINHLYFNKDKINNLNNSYMEQYQILTKTIKNEINQILKNQEMGLNELLSKYGKSDYVLLEINRVSETYDYDKDGLLDYYELYRNFTDPENPDSDGDGILDGDWEERKEYAYTLNAKVKIYEPYDMEHMNTFTQDIRLLSKEEDFAIFELIFYPYAEQQAVGEYNWTELYDETFDIYLKSYTATNYDNEMYMDVINMLNDGGYVLDNMTNLQVATDIMFYIEDNKGPTYLDDGGTARLIPYDTKTGEIDMAKIKNNPYAITSLARRYDTDKNYQKLYGDKNLSLEDKLNLMAFAKTMYDENIIGNCTTGANYTTALARMLGIPTRIVVSFPLVTSDDQIAQNYDEIITNKDYKTRLHKLPGATSDHFYPEFYIGNRWVNFDTADEDQNITVTKILDYSLFDHFDEWIYISEYNEKHRGNYIDNLMCEELVENYPIHSTNNNSHIPHIIGHEDEL